MGERSKTVLITGASGLIGSEVAIHFHARGWKILGLDNNMRADFFGPQGDTRWNQQRLEATLPNYQHVELDLRDRGAILGFVKESRPDAVVHAAAQPSHDLAASRPFDDFDVNAVGTMNMLEATRNFSTDVPFVFLSTNKVYGDAPNRIELTETDTRWDFADPRYTDGIDESFGIDQCKHSVFGASKAAADIMVQEYGRYFDMPTCCLRGGCLTGPSHSGVELHGFLSYLVKTNLAGGVYTIFGYKGKQVRDNIHSADVAAFIEQFVANPRVAAVYNLGGGRDNSCSILEAFAKVAALSGKEMNSKYDENARIGDHICYISDLTALKRDYPKWSITKSLDNVFEEIVDAWQRRTNNQ